jgi:FkbM family methyltransferase
MTKEYAYPFSLNGFLRSAYQALPVGMQEALKPVKVKLANSDFVSTRRMNREVDVSAQHIARASANYRGQKIFIDCGMNDGRVLERYMRRLPDFKFYAFEVNPYFLGAAQELAERYPNLLGVKFSAVATQNGTAQFRLAGDPNKFHKYDATTIVPDVVPLDHHGVVQDVETIDFSAWLRSTVEDHAIVPGTRHEVRKPFVAVKMDIEGAEFDVLEDMLWQRLWRRHSLAAAIEDVDSLTVEFHARCMAEDKRQAYEQRRVNILRGLNSAGVLVHEWV